MISILFLLVGVVSALTIYWDVYLRGNRQPMKIMNVVWILTALWGGVFALWAYYSFGRAHAMKMAHMPSMPSMPSIPSMSTMPSMSMPEMKMDRPMWQKTALSALHCGAGCSLADLIGEWFLFFVPMSLFSGWVVDYALALLLGVLFQYAVIHAMEKIPAKQGFIKALKIDFWSLTSWQVGMYGFMAIAIFGFGYQIDRLSWEFWFMMQIAMMCGFITSYPVNWILISMGIKKGM